MELNCQKIMSAWLPLPLSAVKLCDFLKFLWLPQIRVILKLAFRQMKKKRPKIQVIIRHTQVQKMKFNC